MPDYKAEWRIRTREWAYALLGSKCLKCGVTDDLQFDHVDASTKEIEISVAIRDGWGRKRIEVELAKCQLLCYPCHHLKTQAAGENTGGGWNKIQNPEHGSWAMYQREGCKCDVCREWRRLYGRGLVDARGNPRINAVVAQ